MSGNFIPSRGVRADQFALQVALQIQPTFRMRALLHHPDISATYLGNGHVQVRRRLALPSSSVQLFPFNGTCFDASRIALRLPSGSFWHSFLSPSTAVERNHALIIDCSNSFPFLFLSPEGIRRFSPSDGSWTTIAARDIQQAFPFPPLHSYHLTGSYNFSQFSISLISARRPTTPVFKNSGRHWTTRR